MASATARKPARGKKPAAQLELKFATPNRPPAAPPKGASSAAPRGAIPEEADTARPPRRKPPRVVATAESLSRAQREISVSEFFAKNRHLLGFDNKRKALLTTVKEAVDNSLDAAEEAGILPDVWVRIDQIDEERFRVCVRDNGPGIVKQQIPNVFGKLLYGSKFHRLRMSRGQQGIGISAAGMYGLLTTGKSLVVVSRTGAKKGAHRFEIQIDTKKNEPTIVRDEEVTTDWPHGTQVEIELVASYAKGRQSVDEYLELTAIANPHARIEYVAPSGERVEFPRGVEALPEQPIEIKPHPHGIELGLLIRLLHDTKSHWLSGFLQHEFCRVGAKTAEEICSAAKLSPRAHPRRIAKHEAETLYKAIQQTKLMAPPTNCLVPIGAQQLLSGLLKGVQAEFYTASTRPPAVYRGNPFQIEAALAYGGDLGPTPDDDEAAAPGATPPGKSAEPAQAKIIRFANRVPLLYQQSACCAFKSVLDVDWRRYGLSQPGGGLPAAPVLVLVHMVSVWVPFTSESKEAVADYDEIRKEMRLAIQDCGRKLQAYINRRKRQQYEGERRNIFERYIGEVVAACNTIRKIDTGKLEKNLLAIARRVTARADEEIDASGKAVARRSARADDELGENTVVVERSAPPAAQLPLDR
ncbi:MAG: DNA topoisomerase VI subunit B [Phycisphaerae bacterium]